MSNRKTRRKNAKLLDDAKEFLTLSKNLINIQKVLSELPEDALTPERIGFLKSSMALVRGVEPVSKATIEAVQNLKNVPSSAANHTRRAAVADLDYALQQTVVLTHDMIAAIFESTAYLPDDAVSEVEADIVSEQKDDSDGKE